MATFLRLSAAMFCLFFSLLSYQTMSQPQHMQTFCNQKSDNFTQTSAYKSNRETLFSYLRDRSSLGLTYSNATIGLSPNTVHGMFLCRGDINKTSCSDCVKTATLEITKNCTYQKDSMIFYEECMVRYSNFSFFTLVEDRPYVARYYNVSFPSSFLFPFSQTLSKKVEELIILTASNSSLSSSTPYYVNDRNRVSKLDGSYTLDITVQCSPDLDPANCGVCLRLAVHEIKDCCNNARIAHIFLPKCLLKYDTFGLPTAQSPSGSSSTNVMKGNEIFGRILITAITTSVLLALVGL